MCDNIENKLLDLLRTSYQGGDPSPPRKVVALIVTPEGERYTGFRGENKDIHAERIAIDRAGEKSKGSTLYCSLEPCVDIRAAQPIESCANYIVSKGIRKVVFGLFDDNPQIEMKGWQYLVEHGVEVGYFSESCQSMLEEMTYDGPYNEAFSKRGTRTRFVRKEAGLAFTLTLVDFPPIEFRWSIVSDDKMDLISGPAGTVTYSIDQVCFEEEVSPSMFRYPSHYCRVSVGEFAAIKIDEQRCVFVKLKSRRESSIEFQWRIID